MFSWRGITIKQHLCQGCCSKRGECNKRYKTVLPLKTVLKVRYKNKHCFKNMPNKWYLVLDKTQNWGPTNDQPLLWPILSWQLASCPCWRTGRMILPTPTGLSAVLLWADCTHHCTALLHSPMLTPLFYFFLPLQVFSSFSQSLPHCPLATSTDNRDSDAGFWKRH